MPVLMYGRGRNGLRLQLYNLSSLLGVRKIDKKQKTHVKVLYGVKTGIDETVSPVVYPY